FDRHEDAGIEGRAGRLLAGAAMAGAHIDGRSRGFIPACPAQAAAANGHGQVPFRRWESRRRCRAEIPWWSKPLHSTHVARGRQAVRRSPNFAFPAPRLAPILSTRAVRPPVPEMPTMKSRIAHPALQSRVMTADAAAALIRPGSTVGMSGFTGSGYPKAVPLALAARIEVAHAAGDPFALRVWTGASTGPELDGALAKVKGIEFRLPYNSDPVAREQINSGEMEYFDMHLSQVAPMAWQGFLGPL